MASYKESGVDIDAAEEAIRLARAKIDEANAHSGVRTLSRTGGYAGIVELPG